jgi:hypothetical protein
MDMQKFRFSAVFLFIMAWSGSGLAEEPLARIAVVKPTPAVDHLIKELHVEHDLSNPLQKLAALGPAAVDAGPTVSGFLQHADWNIRAKAAYTLGSIEYKNSVPDLIKALSSKTDWHLVYAAIIGLSRLKDPAAVKPLHEVSESYWYPPVRDAADCAARFIENEKKRCEQHAEILDINLPKLQVLANGVGNCTNAANPKVAEREDVKQYGNEEALQEFKYTGAECALHGELAAGEKGEAPCLARRALYPKIAARVADGWLTGRDQGEFGGEVMFFPDQGKSYEVLQENIEDIFTLNKSVFVIAGLAHLSLNNGMVYRLQQDAAGKWQAEPFLRLPGAPQSSYKVIGNKILVKTYGGTIVFDEQANTKMATCGKA